MKSPNFSQILQLDTHRLIHSKFSENGEIVFERIADNHNHLRGISELEQATSERTLAQTDRLPGIGIDELVFGISYNHIINSAFTCTHPLGSRFNDSERGAWYAGFQLETAQAEIAWHKSVEFDEIDWFHDSVTYDDYLADFNGAYHDIRDNPEFERCLNPLSYVDSQKLAEILLAKHSSGIIYPSVRRKNGVCLACFQPALVGNVRKFARYRFTWTGTPEPAIDLEESYEFDLD